MPARITEQTRREIVRLLEENAEHKRTFEEIAVMVDVTPATVGREAYRMGVKPAKRRRGPQKGEGGRPPGLFGENRDRALALKAEGKKATEIAEALGISRIRVYQLLATSDGVNKKF